jgi:hypothetical protein
VAVAGVTRVRQQHLVPGLDECEGDQLQRRRRAGGDDDAPGRHIQTPAPGVPAGQRFAQRRQPGGVRVLRATGGEATRRRVEHRRRRREVRLADVEVEHRPPAASRVAQRAARNLVGVLGALHDVEGVDVAEARGELHR